MRRREYRGFQEIYGKQTDFSGRGDRLQSDKAGNAGRRMPGDMDFGTPGYF